MKTENYYNCSQYESPDGGSGEEWSVDGCHESEEAAIVAAIYEAHGAMLEADGEKIEVWVIRAAKVPENQTEGEVCAYGKFDKQDQDAGITADLLEKVA